ncbi:MAG: hypothetical protein ABDH16_00485 [Thermodesulfovibrionaceae bacterium]
MKILNTKEIISNLKSEEYVIGYELTSSHACYMIYGKIDPQDKPRLVKPGKGHEEIVLIIKGKAKIGEVIMEEGDSFHIVEDEHCYIENISNTELIYIIAGGHSESGHKH